MIVAGLDVGAQTIKAVILKDGAIVGQAKGLIGLNQRESVERVLAEAISQSRCSRDSIQRVVATGAAGERVSLTKEHITELVAAARGAIRCFPSARTIIDVGAEGARGARCDARGTVTDYVTNEKCAAGAGTFIEAMARALEVPLDRFGEISLTSSSKIPMNAQCVVFAESEVVSLIHAKTSKADIAKAVHDAVASRVSCMVRRIGVEKEVVLIGGVAHNPGFAESLKVALGAELLVPQNPEFISALGAALVAAA